MDGRELTFFFDFGALLLLDVCVVWRPPPLVDLPEERGISSSLVLQIFKLRTSWQHRT